MDHLPPIETPFQSVIEIQYIAPEGLDVPFYNGHNSDDFGSFPARVGWDDDTLVKGRYLQRDPRVVAAFVQQWHFFGLLSAFGRHRQSAERMIQMFTRQSTNTGGRVLSTRTIETYLAGWRDSLSDADLQLGSAAQMNADQILLVTQRHVALYMSRGGEYSERHPMRLFTDISFSIIALCVILARAKRRTWPRSRDFAFRHSELILWRFERAGWCPSDIEMLKRSMTPLAMYFFSLFPPRMRDKDHLTGACDKNSCALMNITEEQKKTYRTVHSPGCDEECEWHYMEEEKLLGLTNHDDAILVVRFTTSTEGSSQLISQCIKADGDVPFVAISHVWAEGLGHTTQNALPACQLARIQNLVDQLSDAAGISFWIDTLSVPQDWGRENSNREKFTSARRVAMQSMNAVYENAFAVLVLDAELGLIREEASLEERLVRFICSSWLRRLWTLNEAILGRKVMLQFQSRAVDMLEEIFDRLEESHGALNLSQTISTEFATFIWRIKRLRAPITEAEKVTELWNACQYRSTSELHDEAWCLATCLKQPIDQIIGEFAKDKWRAFIGAQKTFPKELLFTQVERIDRDGYRWAPASFIRRPGSEMVQVLAGTGLVTPYGVELPASGVSFNAPRKPLQFQPDFFWVQDDVSLKWYRVMKSSGIQSEKWRVVIDQITDHKKFAIVANHSMRNNDMALGVLVAIRDDIEDREGNSSGAITRFMSTCNIMPEFEEVVAGVEEYQHEEMQPQAPKRRFCTVLGHLQSESFLWTVG